MKIRKITSLTALLSFLLTILTSIILYLTPHGRVAYWSDWTLWGLSKDEWGAIHINLGFLFILALLLHIFYNWKPIVSYLKNKAKELKIFTLDFNIALIITIVFTLGTYFTIPPFSTILDINEMIKEKAIMKYGEPPYGHAELSSLKSFCRKMGIDPEKSKDLLKKAGYRFQDENDTLKSIGLKNGVSPQEVFNIIKSAMAKEEIKRGVVPRKTPMGTGNLSLAEFCSKYGLDLNLIINSLNEMNITSVGKMTIKEIAKSNNTSPTDIIDKLRSVSME